MSLGEIVLVVLLPIAGLMLYHFWPVFWPMYALRRVGEKLGLSHEEMLKLDPQSRWEMVLTRAQKHYTELCNRVEKLVDKVAASRPRVGERLQELRAREFSVPACRELQNILVSLELYDLLEDYTEYEMKTCENKVIRLEEALRKLTLIRKRLRGRRLQTA